MTITNNHPGFGTATLEPPVDVRRRACSADEFSPLREIVVGRAAGAVIPQASDPSAWLTLYSHLDAGQVAAVDGGALPQQVIEESEEDLETLAETLRGLGVVVHRPSGVDHAAPFSTPHWDSASGMYSYCPRDLTLIVGETIIETPSPVRARYHELDGLRELFRGYLLAGSAWISAPKPQLRDSLYGVGRDGLPVLTEDEPAFEAANVLRCGRDLFYQVSTSGNEFGRIWLESLLGPQGYRVHPVRDVYPHTHLDSTISLLRPGLVLLNPSRVTEDNIPGPLRDWDRIWCPEMRETGVSATGQSLSSPWLGMNLLMVNPELAVVDSAQHELIAQLERHGISVLPHTLRHDRALGGGFHCVTLDTVRDAPAGADYFG
ncbi:inosamine-phosphate amidinotransferase 1 [Streptomyces sp. SL13]|uniref:Inosamine-phosphate amidinotransferase 1 n=1 Tax=Streptantibioticus silvisoli TaxID=2705255 RepID=A0AA90H5B9_9ACTN|nr:inosamine-phosphate amidinotransferase 1 [Streptantibioticus silvisoli]MDI5970939.1 inosamine-phosphate amidinotransferase 1 [Streptantibioticus silvisoli]